MSALRLCFIGDSIVNGYGDSAVLGWTGRVCAAAGRGGHDLTHYDLGVRGDTTALIRTRWRAEAAARLPDAFKGALVFGFGINDCVRLDGVRRVEPQASLDNARAIFAAALAWRPTLYVGPTPIDARHGPPQLAPGATLELDNRDIAELGRALCRVASDTGVPALDLFTVLSDSSTWAQALAEGDGVHPGADGYAQIAERVGAWPAWRTLLGI